MSKEKGQIGKDVIESLTLGMYEDCRYIYREYIQNAADSVDKAVKEGIISKGSDQIMVNIDVDKRRIIIEDNARGIPSASAQAILRDIAHSTKKRGEDKGFRGIGRLGGLGYCSTLTFTTSFPGEDCKSIMVWDADRLKNIINDRDTYQEAADVLIDVTKFSTSKEKADIHYFKVELDGITTDDLLDVNAVRDYLSMVAPVDISSNFLFKKDINKFMKDNCLSLDTYNIFINSDQVYKPYTSYIYEDNHGGKKKVDEILGVDFLLQNDSDGNVMYWGWYTISGLHGQMKQKNLARGIRLRKENIQIGDEEICRKFFTKTEDQRFSFYFFGEIHAVSKGLIPNSRRDYFGESDTCQLFEKLLRNDFIKLKDLCYDASRYRTAQTTINKTEEIRQEIAKKEAEGYTSKTEREDLQRKLEEQKKKQAEAEKTLKRVKEKMEEHQSPLLSHLDSISPQSPVDSKPVAKQKDITPVDFSNIKTKFRTDGPKYSAYKKNEKKLIGRIYDSIKNFLPAEMGDLLINKIEEDITK